LDEVAKETATDFKVTTKITHLMKQIQKDLNFTL